MDVHHVQVVIFHQQEMDPLLLHDPGPMVLLFGLPWMAGRGTGAGRSRRRAMTVRAVRRWRGLRARMRGVVCVAVVRGLGVMPRFFEPAIQGSPIDPEDAGGM